MAASSHINATMALRVIFRAADPELAQLRQLVFKRYPGWEWATFIRCGWRSLPDGLIVTLTSVDAPRDGDLDETVGHVAIQEPYSLRAALGAERHPLAVGVVHSHPAESLPRASSIDDDMDSYYAEYFSSFAPGRPYVSLILAKHGDDLVISGRVWWHERWLAIGRAIFDRTTVTTWPGGRPPEPDPKPRTRIARLSAAFGLEADERLRESTVAVIGAGGTGSSAIETLARAGVGRLVIVDPDTIEPSNLERVHGSTEQHVRDKWSKVAVAAHHVKSISPECDVAGFIGRLPQAEIVNAIVGADVMLGCTDSQHSRLALSDIAVRYLVPSLDCGVALEGGSGKVSGQIAQFTRFLPADPCALCRRMIIQRRLDQELMSEEERELRRRQALGLADGQENPYWQADQQLNTVGYHTTMAGAVIAGYAIGWITRRFEPPFTKLQMNLTAPLYDVTDGDYPARPYCSCQKSRGWADQGRIHALIDAPPHWAAVRRVS